MRPLRTARPFAVLAAVLALVACGQNTRQTPTAKATPRVPPTVAATVNPAPSPSATATESESAAPSATAAPSSAAAKPNSVQATVANKFVPGSLTVKKGTTVTWTADPGTFHSAQSGTPPTVDQSGPIHKPIGFTTFTVKFDKPGVYKYFCEPHASLGMVGEIVVT